MVLFRTQRPPLRSAERSRRSLDGGRALRFFNVYRQGVPIVLAGCWFELGHSREASLVTLSRYNFSIAKLQVEVNTFFFLPKWCILMVGFSIISEIADRLKPTAGGHFVPVVHLRGRGFCDRVDGRPALERPLAPISIGAPDEQVRLHRSSGD